MKSFLEFIKENIDEKISNNLEYHDKLNPVFWDENDNLKPEIREKLLSDVQEWVAFTKVPMNIIHDFTLSGGNCNYNYTPLSDVDVHMVVDKSAIGTTDFANEYFKDKMMLWKLKRKNVKIKGYPLEFGYQGVGEPLPKNQGAYSLKDDKWLTKPQHLDSSFMNDPHLIDKAEVYDNLVDKMIEENAPLEKFNELKKKFGEMRTAGLMSGGEFSPENLLFKLLRNNGVFDKMNAYMDDVYDRQLSLENADELSESKNIESKFYIVYKMDNTEHTIYFDAKNENDARKKLKDYIKNTYPWTPKLKIVYIERR